MTASDNPLPLLLGHGPPRFHRTLKARFLAAALALGVLVEATAAWAGDDADAATTKERAQALFNDAIRAMEHESYAEACPLLEESFRLDPAGGTALNMAFCHEHAGDVVRAYEDYGVAKEHAASRGNDERVRLAERHRHLLAAKIGTANIRFATENGLDAAAVASVSVDGRPLGVGPRTVLLTIGDHAVTVSAEGCEPWSSRFSVVHEAAVDVIVALRPSAHQGAPNAGAAKAPLDRPLAPGPVRWVAGAAGLAALGVGATFGILALARHDESNAQCPGGACSEGGVTAERSAKRLAIASDISIAAGVVLVGIAAYLWLRPSDTTLKARMSRFSGAEFQF